MSSQTQSDDDWINVESDSSDAPPDIIAAVLESTASTLRNAPDGTRYKFELEVKEL